MSGWNHGRKRNAQRVVVVVVVVVVVIVVVVFLQCVRCVKWIVRLRPTIILPPITYSKA